MTDRSSQNRVRIRRLSLCLTQAELADRAGISRTAVTAIEGDRLVPSVAAALGIASALSSSVEELFGAPVSLTQTERWSWEPASEKAPCWRAEVNGGMIKYPAATVPMWTPLPDSEVSPANSETLVLASCDPAAGLLASQFGSMTGMRLLVIPRSSRKSLEMLRDGVVHLAGLHLSTEDEPDLNAQVVRETLGHGYQLVRVADWYEGIVTGSQHRLRSIEAAGRAKMTWVGRELGSGARNCLDRVLGGRRQPRHQASHHRGVVEAVQSGWADAGVCIEFAGAEAGLRFLPVQRESYEICFPSEFAEDRRLKAFLNVVRSTAYRQLLRDLPGYNTQETGQLSVIS